MTKRNFCAPVVIKIGHLLLQALHIARYLNSKLDLSKRGKTIKIGLAIACTNSLCHAHIRLNVTRILLYIFLGNRPTLSTT